MLLLMGIGSEDSDKEGWAGLGETKVSGPTLSSRNSKIVDLQSKCKLAIQGRQSSF